MAALSGSWALATPVAGSADEPAHVNHAAAIARGELTGATLRPPVQGVVSVELPASYGFAARRAHCFAGLANEDASCFHFRGSESATEPVLTDAGRHPPAYYVLVGVVSRVMPTAAGAVYVMRAMTVLMTALFLTMAVRALLRAQAPRLVLTGLVVALTPMVLAFSGVVNPSALETAAAVATWACGLTLIGELRRGEPPDRGLVSQLGIAASAFVLSRQISMFWIAIIGVIFASLLGMDELRRLSRAVAARAWAAVVVACTLLQLAWIRFAHGLDLSMLGTADPNRPVSEIVRTTVGRSSRLFVEMLGIPGSLDARLLALTYLLLIAALGALMLSAVALGSRRYVIAMLAALVITVVVPIGLEAVQAREYGFYWQGRYTLPFAVGVPLLAAFALQWGPSPRLFVRGAFIPTIGGMVVVAQFLGFYQALRRWSVGANGAVVYWLEPEWNAPVPQWLLIVVYGAVFGATVVWLLGTGRAVPSVVSR